MSDLLKSLVDLVSRHNGINDKSKLTAVVTEAFGLTQDRSVYYRPEFAIRFSSAQSEGFSNTVLSLSNLQKVDDRPFVVCFVIPKEATVCCWPTRRSCAKKATARKNSVKTTFAASFNGSDIMREFEGIANTPANFERLYSIHEGLGFDGNVIRLVEATRETSPTGKKYLVTAEALATIMDAPVRAERVHGFSRCGRTEA